MKHPGFFCLILQILVCFSFSFGLTKEANEVTYYTDKELAKSLSDQYTILQSIRMSVLRNTDGLKKSIQEIIKQRQAIEDLKKNCQINQLPTTTTTPTTTTQHIKSCPEETLDYNADEPCLFVSESRLEFDAAFKFCQFIGGKLANSNMESVIARLALMYGEYGTRVRWPFWVSAKRIDDSWDWIGPQQNVNGDELIYGVEALNLFQKGHEYVEVEDVEKSYWKKDEPRASSPDQEMCMILDGYSEYKASTLRCDQKRRFICQLPRV